MSDHTMNDTSNTPTSAVHIAAMMTLLMIMNWEVWMYSDLQWYYGIHTS